MPNICHVLVKKCHGLSQFAHVLNVLTVGLSFRVHLEKCDSYSSSRECQGPQYVKDNSTKARPFLTKRQPTEIKSPRRPTLFNLEVTLHRVSQLANLIFFALGEAACWDFLEEHWKEVLQHTANLEETFFYLFFCVQFIAFKSCRFHRNVWNFR